MSWQCEICDSAITEFLNVNSHPICSDCYGTRNPAEWAREYAHRIPSAEAPCPNCGSTGLTPLPQDMVKCPSCEHFALISADDETPDEAAPATTVATDTVSRSPPKYMEAPKPSGTARCSDNSCPCTSPDDIIPEGGGYIYVSEETATVRAEYPTIAELRARDMARQSGLDSLFGGGGFSVINRTPSIPILMCERAARRRGLNLEVAAADAAHWWKTSQVPIRATPLAPPGSEDPKPAPKKSTLVMPTAKIPTPQKPVDTRSSQENPARQKPKKKGSGSTNQADKRPAGSNTKSASKTSAREAKTTVGTSDQEAPKTRIRCGKCRAVMKVSVTRAGQHVRCTSCDNVLRIPDAEQIKAAAARRRQRTAQKRPLISVECPECFATYRVKASLAGKRVRCKTCEAAIVISTDAPAASPKATAKPPGRTVEVITSELEALHQEFDRKWPDPSIASNPGGLIARGIASHESEEDLDTSLSLLDSMAASLPDTDDRIQLLQRMASLARERLAAASAPPPESTADSTPPPDPPSSDPQPSEATPPNSDEQHELECPFCEEAVTVPHSALGSRVVCQSCRSGFEVPNDPAELEDMRYQPDDGGDTYRLKTPASHQSSSSSGSRSGKVRYCQACGSEGAQPWDGKAYSVCSDLCSMMFESLMMLALAQGAASESMDARRHCVACGESMAPLCKNCPSCGEVHPL